MNYKVSSFVVFSIFLLFSVSATGLQVSPSFFSVNITSGQIQNITFNITNTDTKSFYNVTFEPNYYLSMSKIPLMTSGNRTVVTANITGYNSFNGTIRTKGLFLSNLGQTFLTKNVDVYYENGSNQCNITLIKGDTVIFYNHLSNSINLRNANTNDIVSSLNANSTYTVIFDIPQVFTYYFSFLGVDFTGLCTITVLDTTGYVNDPTLDGAVNLNLTILYPNTNIQVNVPTTNYTLSVGSSTQDLMTIRNNGNETAKNIYLSSDWFSFSSNNFDLSPNQSRNIGYTITPTGFTYSNQTGINYIKNLTITGNFQNINNVFNIFINYQNISSSIISSSLDELIITYWNVIRGYCSISLNSVTDVCKAINSKTLTQIQSESNLSIQNQLVELAKGFAEDLSSREFQRNIQDIQINDIKLGLNDTINRLGNLSVDFNVLNDKQTNLSDGMTFFGITIAAIVIIIMIIAIMYFINRNKTERTVENYY